MWFVIPVLFGTAGTATYLHSPSLDDNPQELGRIPTENPFILAAGGGMVANVGTKVLSKVVLGETAKTSIKYGFYGAGIDASMQVGSQIYDQAIHNNGNVNL